MNAIVTGCTKGIGKAIVLELADMGFHIYGCARTTSDLHTLKEELKELYPNVEFKYDTVDVSSPEEVKRFGQHVLREFGRVDLLVNNTGIFLPGSIHEEPSGNFEKQMHTNLFSAYHLTREIVPQMKISGSGQIINICSVASIKAYPNGGSYAISKFALYGMTKCLREELKPHNIRVNAILPGATWSDSWAGADLDSDRLMDAEDIAKTVRLCIELKEKTVMEEAVIRPQLGDL